jgi:hypothetical protein
MEVLWRDYHDVVSAGVAASRAVAPFSILMNSVPLMFPKTRERVK